MQKRRSYPLFLELIVLAVLACNLVLPQNEPTTVSTQIKPTVAPTRAQSVQLTQPVPPQGNLPQTEDAVPRISVVDAKAAIDSGQAVIVDVRGAEFFKQSHVAGALNIPLVDIEINPAGVNLDQNQWIITYCT